ncbi:hypothetical protein BCD67_24140 [Oscillatoriales cyanobacterium USR001]|nr:hypothetical protein BCD67_24140 [Oscillatoriales cyanobacterium USR001]
MRYSLLSKFQGTLLGAALGDFLGLQYQRQISHLETTKVSFSNNSNKTQPIELRRVLAVPSWRFDRQDFRPHHADFGLGGQVALLLMQSLIQCNGLDLKDWREIWVKFSDSQRMRIDSHGGDRDRRDISIAEEFWSRRNLTSPFTVHTSPLILHPGEVAIATLPVAIFFHENKVKLREKLGELTHIWQSPSYGEQDLVSSAACIGYAIARACKEKLNPATLIPEIITYLGIDTPLAILLLQVQILLEQEASLEAAVVQLCKIVETGKKKREEEKDKREAETSSPYTLTPLQINSFLPIAIAFYCFLSTPEDFRLAVIRAARTGVEPQLTCSLVGSLSGSYNSVVAIPVEWRVAVGTNSESGELAEGSKRKTALTNLLWNRASEGEIMELAAHLLAVWSGVFHSCRKPLTNPVVAAPYVIRPY